MKANYTLRARAEMQEIGEYVSRRNPRAASRVIAAIYRSVDIVCAFPENGRKQRAPGVRKVGAGKYPYNIY